MQKSQRGLTRSAKQQKRKQKLFALCNNNNPINCRQSPSLPLLEPAFWSLLTVGDSAWEASPPTTPTRGLGAGLMCHSSPGLELMRERAPKKEKKKKQVAHIDHWEPEMGVWDGIWGGWDLPSRQEVNLGLAKSIPAELRLCMWKDDQPPLFRGYKIILMIKIHHLASPL